MDTMRNWAKEDTMRWSHCSLTMHTWLSHLGVLVGIHHPWSTAGVLLQGFRPHNLRSPEWKCEKNERDASHHHNANEPSKECAAVGAVVDSVNGGEG